MRLLLQRVSSAGVTVDNERIASINRGILVMVGVGRDDRKEDAVRMAKKVSSIRIFEDGDGKMNQSIAQVSGEVLSVPQFTLYADTSKGNRPGFEMSAKPGPAETLWKDFGDALRAIGITVREGVFGAHMKVDLVNDGPVSIWLDHRG